MLTILAGAIIAPGLPQIEERFDIGVDQTFAVALLLTITSLFIALAAPLMGYFIDRIGRRPVLLTCMVLYGIFGSAGLYLNGLDTLLISRILLGVAVAGIMTSCFTLTGDYFQGIERERFFGYQSAFIALGGFVFMTAGGLLAAFSWRAPFGLYLFSWLLLIPAYLVIDEPKHAKKKSLESAPFSLGTYLLILLALFTAMSLYFMAPTRLPFLLYSEYGFSPAKTGLFLGASTLFSAVASSNYARIHRYFSKPALFGIAFTVMGLGMSMIAGSAFFAGIASLGLGFGLVIPNCTTWVTQIAPEAVRGRLIGLLSTSLFTAQFASTFLGEALEEKLFFIGGLACLTLGISILLYCKKQKHMRPL